MPVWLINIVVGVVLNLAVSLAQQAFSPKDSSAAIRGFRGDYSSGGTTPLRIVLGTYGVPGHLEYSNTWGAAGKTPNAYLADVLSISDYLIEGVTASWIDTQPVTLPGTGAVTQGYPIPEYADGGADYAWYRFLDGSQSTALSYLTAKFGSDPDRPWEAGMVGEGIAQAVMTSRIHETLWTGFPNYMFEVEGAPLLDPRESTTLGGSGSQVWGTVSTYAFSDNPVVLIYNILRGLYDADGNHIWGGRATPYQLPYAAWAAAMDRCDDAIDLNGGGTEKRYRAGIEFGVIERPTDVIRELLIGCNGRIAYHQGQYFPLVDVPEGAADGSFTDADILADQPIRTSLFPNLDDVVNGAAATFMAPERAWESKETAPYYRADLEAEDDDRRLLQSLTLRTVFSGTQAQRILKEVVEESRRFKRHVVPFPPAFGVYRPLQVLAWTSTEFQYTAKKWLITAKTEDEWGNILLGLHEIDPADNGWDETTDETPLNFAPLTPIVAPAQDADDFDAEGTTFLDNDGMDRRPGIKVIVAGDLDDVRCVHVEVTLDGSADVEFDQELPYDPAVTEIVLPKEFVRNTVYEVRGQYIPFDGSGRTTNPSDWIAVTTPDIGLTADDIDTVNASSVLGELIESQIADAAITADKLATNAVIAVKIAAGAVEAAKLAVAAVTSSAIDTGAVIAAKIGAGAVTTAKIAADAVTATELAANAVDAAAIQTGAVLTAKIAGLAVTSAELAASAVTTAKIAADAVTATELAANAVDAAAIQTGAVLTAKIAALAVTTAELGSDAVTSAKILANTIVAGDIAAGTITTTQIASATIVAGNIASGTITTTQIAATTIVAGNIASGTITGTQIAATTIAAGNIIASTITTSQIAATTIVAGNIAAGTITTTQIASATIVAGNIATGTITATQIAAATITGAKMVASSITARELVLTDWANILPDGDLNYCSNTYTVWGDPIGSNRNFVNTVGGQNGRRAGNLMFFTGGAVASGGTVNACGVSSQLMPVAAGDTYAFYGTVALPSGTGALTAIAIYYNTGGSVLAVTTLASVTSGVSTTYDTILTMPANTSFLGFWVYRTAPTIGGTASGDSYAYNLYIRKAQNASLIVDGAITAVKITAGTITSTQIASDTITSGNILAGTVAASDIATGTITATQIAAATITGANMVAGTLTAREIILTDFSNVLPDGDLYYCGDTAVWPDAIGTNRNTISTIGGQATRKAGNLMAFASGAVAGGATTNASGVSSKQIPVAPGDTYAFKGEIVVNAGNGGLVVLAVWRNVSNSVISSNTLAAATAGGAAVPFDTILTTPALCVKMEIWVYRTVTVNGGTATGAAYFYDAYIRKAQNASLIVDGAITAAKITAGAIIAGKISAGAIDASSLMVDGVVITAKLLDYAVNDVLEDTTLTSPAAWASPPAGYAGGTGLGTSWCKIGTFTVSASSYPVSISAFLRFVPNTTTTFRAFITVTESVSGEVHTLGDIRSYTATGSSTYRAPLGGVMNAGTGTYTVDLWLGANAVTLPTIHSDSKFNGTFTKK